MTTSKDEAEYNLAQKIGEICFLWNHIEWYMVDLAFHLSTAICPAFDKEEIRDVFVLPLIQLDIRGKIAVNKALAHKATSTVCPNLYEQTAKLLNTIDNVLRPERNRFVHDQWVGHDEFKRLRYNLRVTNTQSRTPELQISTKTTFANPDNIDAFVKHLEDCAEDVESLDLFACGLAYKTQPVGLREQLPAEWKSSSHRAWQTPDKP